MNVTLANIRREYAVTRSRWAEVIGLSTAFLAACETVRQALRQGWATWLAAVAGLLVAAFGWWAAVRVAGGVRRATLDGELWRKFGLRPELTAACAALPELPAEVSGVLDRALGDLRSLAAVANHAEEDDPGDA
ncbi:MAG: hypothetical protein HYU66_27920, partial [Armatimonadetes bacterium]|nr:hypothetical protein [Armatimonadota bacterium]